MPAEELNEDVDAGLLDQLLRECVEGMSARQAKAKIGSLGKSVEAWLADSDGKNAVAAWLLGYLAHPDLGRELTSPPQPAEAGPQILFDTPEGWTESREPFRLVLSNAGVLANITAVDQFTFEVTSKQNEHWVSPPHLKATRTTSEVSLESCRGKKYVYVQQGAQNWKRVEYVLTVPGGFAVVWIGTESGDDFDESPIEDQLSTLALENFIE